MIVRNPSKNHATTICALTLFAIAIALSISGCKRHEEVAKRTPVTAPPAVKKHLYSAEADPKAEIATALQQAAAEHKRVILDFGGDWCGDCQVLDIYLHQPPNLELLNNNFVLIHVDIGHFDKNLDIPDKYGVPLKKGVPALAVLDASGNVVYSQQAAEFGDMRYMYPASVTDFLTRWKT
ncbi:MAG: thioredoxin family protein [Edaphobacter sp.]